MRSLIIFVCFFTNVLWALEFSPDVAMKLKAKMDQKSLFELLKIPVEETSKRFIFSYKDSPCVIELETPGEQLSRFALSCDKALEPGDVLPANLKWERRPSLNTGSSLTHDSVVGNPEHGFILHLNAEQKILSFHVGESWRSTQKLKELTELKIPPATRKLIWKKAKKK